MRQSLLLAPLCILGLAACGSDTTSGDTSADTTAATAQAASESADSAGNSDSSLSGASQAGQAFMAVAPQPFQASFDIDGCVGTIKGDLTLGSTSTFDANITVDATTCLRGRTFSGTESIAATFSGGTRTVNVTSDLNMTVRSGDVVNITSDDKTKPTYSLVATGSPSSAGGNVTLNANINEHRVRNTSTGAAVYDIDVTTDAGAAIAVINVYTNASTLASRTLVSGSNTVQHNLAKYAAKHTFKNLTRTLATCNCPDGGTLTQDVTLQAGNTLGTGTFTKIYTFTGCGTGTFTVSNSTVTSVSATGAAASGSFAWDSCN